MSSGQGFVLPLLFRYGINKINLILGTMLINRITPDAKMSRSFLILKDIYLHQTVCNQSPDQAYFPSSFYK